MDALAQNFIRLVEGLSRRAGSVAGWTATALIAVVCFDVTTRYFFDFSWVAVQEAQWHLFALIFLLGAAATLEADRHVRVDVLSSRWSPRARAMIELAGVVLLLVPFCLLGIKLCWDYTLASFAAGEGSPQPGGLPARYLLKALMPTGLLLLLLQGLASGLKSWLALRSRKGS